jgi:polysaccharide deacetylase family protein (PEP-CTERM system associated)
MNILTFDIEDWYNCDFKIENFMWEKYEIRIYEGVNRILEELEKRNLKGTFFCLGWLAEKHPTIIKEIYKNGHQIGCHSYQHQLSYKFSKEQFLQDTDRAKKLLEDVTGDKINSFRAPGFSIIKSNIDYFEVLINLGFIYDASIFPAFHDYGGLPNFGDNKPFMIETYCGVLKEFPMTVQNIFNKTFVFSGGGFFRLLPYSIIKKFSRDTEYLMTYFHPRDFDPGQPVLQDLSIMRKFKSYVGLKKSFDKFKKYIDDFAFINIEHADSLIDWENSKKIKLL